MRVRRTPEQDLEDTRAELAEARTKAARWNGRVAELEELVTEKENMLILRAVRSVASSPEDLRGLLDLLKGASPLPALPVPPIPELSAGGNKEQTEKPSANREGARHED